MLLEGIQHLLKALRDEDDANDPEDGLFSEVDKVLQSSYGFTDLVLGLQRIAGKATDPQNEAKQNPKGEAKSKAKNKGMQGTEPVAKQSFYGDFWAKAKLVDFQTNDGPKGPQHEELKGPQGKGKGKGQGKTITNGGLGMKGQAKPLRVPGFWGPRDHIEYTELVSDLENGVEPVGKVCFVTPKQALLCQRLATAHSIRQPVTLLMEHTTDKQALPDGAVEQRYELERRGLTKVFAVALNPSVSKVPDRKIQVHEIKDPLKEASDLVPLRVHVLRLLQDNKEWEQIKKKPASLFSSKVGTNMAKGYGWKVVVGDETEVIAGFLRVGKDLATTLLLSSGESGIFIERLWEDPNLRPPIKWIKRVSHESLGDYHKRSLGLAVSNKFPLVFRKGGGTSLGLSGLKDEDAWGSVFRGSRALRWSLNGLRLGARGWSVKEGLSPPRTKKQGWLFGGKAPSGIDPSTTQVYLLGDKKEEVVIQKWIRNSKHWQERSLVNSSGWVQPPKLSGETKEVQVAASQMEIDSQEQEAATLTEETKEGQKRVPPGVTGASPDKKKQNRPQNEAHRHYQSPWDGKAEYRRFRGNGGMWLVGVGWRGGYAQWQISPAD